MLSSVLAGCGSTQATATTPSAPKASPTSVANPFAFDSKTPHAAQSVLASTRIVAQRASGTRYLGPIQFPFGATSASVTNFVEGSGIDRYTFDASAKQPARININSATGQVLLTLIAPDGTPITRLKLSSFRRAICKQCKKTRVTNSCHPNLSINYSRRDHQSV